MKTPTVRHGHQRKLVERILTYSSSCLVIDPKGDLCAMIRKRPHQQRHAPVLNPFDTVLKKRKEDV